MGRCLQTAQSTHRTVTLALSLYGKRSEKLCNSNLQKALQHNVNIYLLLTRSRGGVVVSPLACLACHAGHPG